MQKPGATYRPAHYAIWSTCALRSFPNVALSSQIHYKATKIINQKSMTFIMFSYDLNQFYATTIL